MSGSDLSIPGDWVRAAIAAVTQTSPQQILFARRAGCRVRPARAKPIAGNREPVHGLHRHDMPELCIAIGGAALLSLDGVVFELREPRLAVVAPGVDHFEAAVRQRQSYSLMWMHFRADGSLIALLIQYRPAEGWNCVQRFVMGPSPGHYSSAHVASLISTGNPGEPQQFEAIRTDLLGLLADLNRAIVQAHTAGGKKRRPAAQPHLDILRGVEEFLNQNFTRRLSVREIAASSRFSPDYLNAMFCRWKGQSIGDYLITLRMEAALAMCREGKLMIKEIALSLGYEDALYFSRAFHRYHGFYPTETKSQFNTEKSI